MKRREEVGRKEEEFSAMGPEHLDGIVENTYYLDVFSLLVPPCQSTI